MVDCDRGWFVEDCGSLGSCVVARKSVVAGMTVINCDRVWWRVVDVSDAVDTTSGRDWIVTLVGLNVRKYKERGACHQKKGPVLSFPNHQILK